MKGFSTKVCPNIDCNKRFYDIQEVVDPRLGLLQDFFVFVNLSHSGRITKDELADWYTTNFVISRSAAMEVIRDNWQSWDVPKHRALFGFMRSFDQGNLDKEEFTAVQEFMRKAFKKRQVVVAEMPTTSNSLAASSATADQPVVVPGHALPVGKCEMCMNPFQAARFALYYDRTKHKRSCKHLVCGHCRCSMQGASTKCCPNSACNKRFYELQEVVDPHTGSLEDFFIFVNLSCSGRITKDELADWYTTNFRISHFLAMAVINDSWQTWDEPKNRAWLGFMRSSEHGDLDKEEFPAVREFMKKAFKQRQAVVAATPTTSNALATSSATGEPPQKRPRPDSDERSQNSQLNMCRKSEELKQKLCNDDGREWFEEVDSNKNGKLEKKELTNAVIDTSMGNRADITGMIESFWPLIDKDDSGSVEFEEFKKLREALLLQMGFGIVAFAGTSQ